jgi:S1-C subfamily serine protease
MREMILKKGKRNLPIAYLFSLFFLFLSIPSIVEATIPGIVLKQKRAVVTIYINDKDGQQIATASGFIIEANGIIATNYHVVSKWYESWGNTILFKMENGAFYPAETIISVDQNNDIALVKVDGKELPTVKLATEYKPKQGESIVVIGSPLGLETTISDGIISSLRGKEGIIQITAPISPGSSGSPVFNLKGEAIGVATFVIQGGQNLNFAIPVKHIANLMAEYKKPKKNVASPQTPYLTPPESLPEMKTPSPAPPESVQSRDLANELEKAKAEVKKKPDNAEAYFHLGLAYGKSGMNKEALEAFKEGIRLDPNDAMGYVGLGIACRDLGMYKEAVEAFKQVVKIIPDGAKFHYELGYAYNGLRMNKEALEAYKQAIRLDPNDAMAYVGFGISCTESTGCKAKEAVEALKKAVEIDPKLSYAHLVLGFLYVWMEERNLALEEYKILKNLDPEKANKLFNFIYK